MIAIFMITFALVLTALSYMAHECAPEVEYTSYRATPTPVWVHTMPGTLTPQRGTTPTTYPAIVVEEAVGYHATRVADLLREALEVSLQGEIVRTYSTPAGRRGVVVRTVRGHLRPTFLTTAQSKWLGKLEAALV